MLSRGVILALITVVVLCQKTENTVFSFNRGRIFLINRLYRNIRDYFTNNKYKIQLKNLIAVELYLFHWCYNTFLVFHVGNILVTL